MERDEPIVSTQKSSEVSLALAIALQLQKISTSLIRGGNSDALYEDILQAAVGLMAADMGSIQVFLPDRQELRLLAHRGFHPDSAAFWEYVSVASTSSCGLALSSGARTVLQDVEACDSLAGTGDLAAYRRSGIRSAQSTPLISRAGEVLGMLSTHWREPHQPTELELRTFDVLARQAADFIDRNRIENTLREREEQNRRLAAIVESSNDSIISVNLDGVITSWNKGAESIFGYRAEEIIDKPVTVLIPPERPDEEPAILERIRRGERVDHFETVRRRKDATPIDISLTVSPIRSGSGEIMGASKIARDISERKRSEAQIAILAREAEHRAKNVLATVQAAVHLSRADTPEGLKRTIEGRIQALANVHRLFVETRWVGADLANIIAQEMAPYSREGDGRARIDGPHVMIEPNMAQAIAVTVHELATNAAKYGALTQAGGSVRVEWSLIDDDRFVLRWTENNGPRTQPPGSRGFGMRVMEGMIAGQPKGKINFDWQPQGLICEITLPVSVGLPNPPV
jgi:PAS domain S-box-containing protein